MNPFSEVGKVVWYVIDKVLTRLADGVMFLNRLIEKVIISRLGLLLGLVIWQVVDAYVLSFYEQQSKPYVLAGIVSLLAAVCWWLFRSARISYKELKLLKSKLEQIEILTNASTYKPNYPYSNTSTQQRTKKTSTTP